MGRALERGMPPVAIVEEIAVIAGGTAAADMLAQQVIGGGLGPGGQHRGRGCGREGEARLEPFAGRVPDGIGGRDLRGAVDDRGGQRDWRRRGRARQERGEAGAPGRIGRQRCEERIGLQPGEFGRALGRGGVEMGKREVGIVREHREGRAIDAEGAQAGVALHHPVEQAGGTFGISGLDELQRHMCRLGDGGHGEKIRGRLRIDRHGGQRAGQGNGIARPCGGPGNECGEQKRPEEHLSHIEPLSFVRRGTRPHHNRD